MLALMTDLWMLNRSLVNDDFDHALAYVGKRLDGMVVHAVPSGTRCWTWVVPEKWIISEAWIADGERRLVDFSRHPLHVHSYSLPVDRVVSREELFQHLRSRPDVPAAIPYEFKYYERDWGFCVEHDRLPEFTADSYRVFIDSRFEPGELKIGDFTIPGESDDMVVVVSDLCHPGQVNDSLSGAAVAVELATTLRARRNRLTYKFLFVPETIGSIAYLSRHEHLIPRMRYAMFADTLGNDNTIVLQRSRQDASRIDRVARSVMRRVLGEFREGPFRSVIGNDEMVFNGPGVEVPTISLTRCPAVGYHSSADTPAALDIARVDEARAVMLGILETLDRDFVPVRRFRGPVFLSGYGLWVDWRVDPVLNRNLEKVMVRLEGDRSAFDIADELGLDFEVVRDYLERFHGHGLIEKRPAEQAFTRLV